METLWIQNPLKLPSLRRSMLSLRSGRFQRIALVQCFLNAFFYKNITKILIVRRKHGKLTYQESN